ncbi:hypothetical protein [Pseudomonas sessilinigenes]|uniref:Uncharacterized protein n=1 Tax=Pseudomonas sessilinigenes TaxID=658629 RepID=A0ABX8MI85_9PSED|nr:hypothetical protein [Pseudomonas sessilinigenes]AZC27038.1 hypothetical protein C4K39_5394 [Pseudomonas sessilinigenes]QXH39007.1 hypothetical protein KSS89_22580 [Pseudomonas sessilinigenes]
MPDPLSSPGYLRLLALQQRIHQFTQDQAAERGDHPDDLATPLWTSDYNYLALAPMRGGLHVEYHGELWDEPFAWTLECLAEQAVASTLSSLLFSGPDTGANGTREWEFTALLDSDATFSQLRSLVIRPTEPEHHNISLVQKAGRIMEEAGEVARFVAKTPYLSELTLPNAPDGNFFEVDLPYLEQLHIGAGSDTQGFIDNLAASSNLPRLFNLDFSESTELQQTWPEQREPGTVTSFASYEKLFASPAFDSVRALRLRNTCLSLEQLQTLQRMRPGLQFMVIQATAGGYVSHFAQQVFPWRHLVQPELGRS